MRRVFTLFFLLVIGGLALAFWLTRPIPFSAEEIPDLQGDAEAGRQVFLAAGCASCHAVRGAEAQQAPILSGGRRLSTRFGAFITPNISTDPEHGIGGYDLAGLASVLKRGVTPDGRHLYPAMPYTSYTRMKLQDIADLKAYLDGLPASEEEPQPHDIALPWSFRSAIGLWKKRYLDSNFVGSAPSERVERGRYLAEALGHCAECHTPRDRFGGLNKRRWMAGASGFTGGNESPNVTPAALNWSLDEIAWYLESGHSPREETASNEMESVIAGLSQLPEDDLEALAFYLASLAPIE